MDEKKIREILAQLNERFENMGLRKEFFHPDTRNPKRDQMLQHCYALLDPMEKHLNEGKLEKVNRWLGFIQCCLWQQGLISLNSIRNTNSIFLN